MHAPIAVLSVLFMGFAGCATAPVVLALAADHPANPDAATAPTSAPSMTLAINQPVRPSPPAAMPGMQHDMGGMQPESGHMDHGTPGAGSPTPGMKPGGHEGHGSGATIAPTAAGQTPATQPAAGQVLYACPMHPEVVSANPNDRCPKCNMKINNPVKKATAPNTPSAVPAGGNASHGGEHGGH